MQKIIFASLLTLASLLTQARTSPARQDIGNLTAENTPVMPAELLARLDWPTTGASLGAAVTRAHHSGEAAPRDRRLQ